MIQGQYLMEISGAYPDIELGEFDVADYEHWIIRMVTRTGMSRADVTELLVRSGGKCEVSGLPFCFGFWGACARNPMAPSVDRINSLKPYAKKNCRVVATCVNFAMNEWGERVFELAARSYIAKVTNEPAILEKVPRVGLSPRLRAKIMAALAARSKVVPCGPLEVAEGGVSA